MRTQIRALATAVVVSATCLSSVYAQSTSSDEPVRKALTKLHKFLGDGDNAKAWDKYLKLSALEAEVAKADAADPAVVSDVTKQLGSGAAGLDSAPFVKLREALQPWAEELALAKSPDLSDAASKLTDKFQAPTADELTSAKDALKAAITKLDKQLAGPNADAWKAYLAALSAQLAADKPDVTVLKTAYRSLKDNEAGLDLPAYATLAEALDHYTNTLVASGADAKEQYGKHLKSLAEALKQYAATPTEELAGAVSSELTWLDGVQQAPALVKVIRGRHSYPNLRVDVSSRFVNSAITRPVKEDIDVVDNILGTSISGKGHIEAKLEARLLNDENRGFIETRLIGSTLTRTVGYNGPATIFSDGLTLINAAKWITLDANGLSQYKAAANAATNSRVNGVSAGGNLVQRIATKRVYESKGEAEQIAASHAADRAKQQLDKQVNEQLAMAQQAYLEKIRNPLVRKGEFPKLAKVRSTPESLYITTLQANGKQLGAPNDNRLPTADGHDVALQVHETWVNHISTPMWGGQEFKQEDVVDQLRDAGLKEMADKLEDDEEKDTEKEEGDDEPRKFGPWRMTLAKRDPIGVVFGDGELTITIRGAQWQTEGAMVHDMHMNITANYKIESAGNEMKLTRQGEVKVSPPGVAENKMNQKQRFRASRLRKQFSKVFEKEIALKPVVFKSEDGSKEIGLNWQQMVSRGGWLTASMVEAKPAATTAAPEGATAAANR